MEPVGGFSFGCCLPGSSSFSSGISVGFFVSLLCLIVVDPGSVFLPVWTVCERLGLRFLDGFLHVWGSHLYPLCFSISLMILSFVVGA